MSEPSLAALAGHDPDAQARVAWLLDRYRREGIAGLRAEVEAEVLPPEGMPTARDFRTAQTLAEAILTLAERSGRGTSACRAWEDFHREEERAEIEREAEGGGA